MLEYTWENVEDGVKSWYTFSRKADFLKAKKSGIIQGNLICLKTQLPLERAICLENNRVIYEECSEEISVSEALGLDFLLYD